MRNTKNLKDQKVNMVSMENSKERDNDMNM